MASSRSHFAISSDQTFHVLGVRHMIRKRIPSSMNTYNCTTVQLYNCIKDVFHPVSYTVDHSLSGLQAKFEVCRLCM